MKNKIALFGLLFPLLLSCVKDQTDALAENASTVTPVLAPDSTSSVGKPASYDRIVPLGTGSGNLVIDGQKMTIKCNDLITIKAGVYTSIDIKNIRSADGCPITIKNDGLVEVTGDFNQMSLTDLKNVTISGDGTPTIKKGFLFRDNKYRAIQIYGIIDKFTLQHIAFRNINDLNISYQYKELYDGSEKSYSKDLKFLNMSCDHTSGLLGTSGSVENGVITGLIKNIEVAYIDFQNSPNVGPVVYMGNAENYDIHNNRVNNVNTVNNNHNGIFSISGNGKFHNNYVSNHQGNAIRAWGHTVGTTPKTILIYNNIVVNSRKYSGFELQAFDASMSPGKTTFTDAIVFNNTCGNLNLSNDWQGNVVDVYSLKGGKCDVYNNIGYNFQEGSVIAGQESDLVPNAMSNLYAKTSAELGLINQVEFRLKTDSPAKSKGVKTPFKITDYYGSVRGEKPSIGAVE